MIAILLVSHGTYATAMLDTARMILVLRSTDKKMPSTFGRRYFFVSAKDAQAVIGSLFLCRLL